MNISISRRKVSSLIEDIERAKNKKTLLFGNIQFDHLKRGNSKEVMMNTQIYESATNFCVINALGHLGS